MAVPLLTANAAPTGTLTQTQTGLVAQDSLTSNTINTHYWTIAGDAQNEKGATYTTSENSSGMYLGARSPGNAKWAGIFTVSPNSNVMLFHANLTLSYSKIGVNSFNTGLYVQTSTPFVNYVTCFGQVSAAGYYWGAEIATGNANQATSYVELWTSPTSTHGPSTESCTIVTNGSNLLMIYMNGVSVYSSTSAGLNMPSPFNSYLEVESSNSNRMLYASYTAYYATLTDKLTVQGVPSGDTVEIVSGSHVLATSGAVTSGTASLEIAQYNMPLSAVIEVLSGSTVVANTPQTSIWGGDTYQFTASSSSSSSSSTTSTVTSSSSTTSSSTTSSSSSSSSSSISTSSSSITTSSTTSTSSSTTSSSSISTSSSTSSSSTTTTTSSSSSSSLGTSKLTVDSVNAAGNAITGYYTVLDQGTTMKSHAYTPAAYTLNSGQSYTIIADGYGSCNFVSWSGAGITGSTSDPATVSITSNTVLTAVYSC